MLNRKEFNHCLRYHKYDTLRKFNLYEIFVSVKNSDRDDHTGFADFEPLDYRKSHIDVEDVESYISIMYMNNF